MSIQLECIDHTEYDFFVTGETYEHKGLLSQLYGVWDTYDKGWVIRCSDQLERERKVAYLKAYCAKLHIKVICKFELNPENGVNLDYFYKSFRKKVQKTKLPKQCLLD